MNQKIQRDPLNILLADDDVDDRLFFNKALTEIPIATHLKIVHDGEELMKYLTEEEGARHLPDVLFLDLSMPRKTGFECLTEIKESETLKDLPVVVFTTSFGRKSDFEQNMIDTLSNIGSLEYISKPGDVEQLKLIIHKVLIKIIKRKALNVEGEGSF